MFRTPVLRASRQLTTRALCAFSGPSSTSNLASGLPHEAFLDPHKHFAMNKIFHFYYIDYYPRGVYPELNIQHNVATRTYEPQVLAILTKHLTQHLKVDLAALALDLPLHDLKWADLFHSAPKEARQLFEEDLFYLLATEIIVRESRWTWTKEQDERLKLTSENISFRNLDTVGDFLNQYNHLIDVLVSYSNFGFAQKIVGDLTPQEKHFQAEMSATVNPGIKDLQQNRPENETLINRLLKILHN